MPSGRAVVPGIRSLAVGSPVQRFPRELGGRRRLEFSRQPDRRDGVVAPRLITWQVRDCLPFRHRPTHDSAERPSRENVAWFPCVRRLQCPPQTPSCIWAQATAEGTVPLRSLSLDLPGQHCATLRGGAAGSRHHVWLGIPGPQAVQTDASLGFVFQVQDDIPGGWWFERTTPAADDGSRL